MDDDDRRLVTVPQVSAPQLVPMSWGPGVAERFATLVDIKSVLRRTRGEAKGRLNELARIAHAQPERFILTRNGRPEAVLLSVDDLEGLEITWTAGLARCVRPWASSISAG